MHIQYINPGFQHSLDSMIGMSTNARISSGC